MIRVEILILTNNIVIPFQDLKRKYDLNYIKFNKLFATRSVAEHGLGYLINIYENEQQLAKFIFDTGSSNKTFIHNLDVRGFPLYDLNQVILSHWHYDHFGSLYNILERINHDIPILTHKDAFNERIFIRTKKYNTEFFKGKTKNEIISFIEDSSVVVQEQINVAQIENSGCHVNLMSDRYNIFEDKALKITVSGEIPRNHEIEDFSNFLYLEDGIYTEDKILDDKSILLEFSDYCIILSGCCHSGIMNTVDYMNEITSKPIKYIIGGLHMAHATNRRMKSTVEFLKKLNDNEFSLTLFPIHCSGRDIIWEINKLHDPSLSAFDTSVGTKFVFSN